MSRATPRSWARTFASYFSRRDLVEALLVAVAFILYFGVRGAVIDRPEVAYRHALDVIDVQRSLGLFWEDDLNNWVKDRIFWSQTMNLVYFYLHFPLIIVFGIWLYYFRRHKYTLTRDAFLLSGAIALVIYWAYPVAPPRELPELAAQFDPNAPGYVHAFVDTLQRDLGYAYDTQSTRAFVNPYAAMPSLHFGWDLLLGLGILYAFWHEGSRVGRWLWVAVPIGLALPVLQLFSITITANHFWLDAAAGGVVAIAGIGLALLLDRRLYPYLNAQVRRIPSPTMQRWVFRDEGVVPVSSSGGSPQSGPAGRISPR